MLRSFLDGAVLGTSSGDGPDRVLLLHGWRRTHADFAVVSEQLAAAGVASTAIDLPGFGASPEPPSPLGARGYAGLLEPLVAEAVGSGERIIVAGHSFGGRVAICLAATPSARIAGVVLCGVPLVRSAMPKARPSRRYKALRRLSAWHVVSEDRLESARRRYGSADYRAASGVMRGVLVSSIAESYEDEIARATCPLALVWGALDTTVPLEVATAARGIAPDATLEVLDGVGHLVPTEAPTRLASAITSLVRPSPTN